MIYSIRFDAQPNQYRYSHSNVKSLRWPTPTHLVTKGNNTAMLEHISPVHSVRLQDVYALLPSSAAATAGDRTQPCRPIRPTRVSSPIASFVSFCELTLPVYTCVVTIRYD